MSEAEEIRRLAPEFLRISNDIGMTQKAPIVRLDQVAEHLDPQALETNGSEYVDRLSNVAQYLGQKGLLKQQTDGWGMFTLTKEGIDEVEGRNQQPETTVNTTFNIESSNFYQSAIGTHNTNSFTGDFDFSTVERHIEEDAEPEDREELRALVNEVKDLLDNGQTLNKGFLARWNDKLQKYNWLRGAVAGWLLNFGTQVAAGG